MLREINIHKINKVVQNKVEKQEKRYFKIVSPNLNNKEKNDIKIKIEKEVKTLNEENKNNNNLKTEEEVKKPPKEENKNNNNLKTEEEAKKPLNEENKNNNSKPNEEIKKPPKEEDKKKSNEEKKKKLNEDDIINNKQHLGQISAKAHAPSQIKGGLPPMQKKNEIIINKNNKFPIAKKKYYEDKRIAKDEQNEEEPEKDLFEEELRNAALKNSAINAFRGIVIKKGDNPEKEVNYNHNKIINDNNNLKGNNTGPLKEKKPKIQPPKQVLEFNAKKENILNNTNSNSNINEIIVKNQSQKDINSNQKTKGRKISRYYYRKDETNREVRKAMAHNKEKILNRNKIKEINLPSNNNNTENNNIYSHRNLRNKRREIIQQKLNNLIKIIDSSIKNISFKKWKNSLSKNQNKSLNSEIKINQNNSKTEDNKDKELTNHNKILENLNKENKEKKNNINIDNKINNKNKEQDEKSEKYDKNNIHDIIKNVTENNFKILKKNIEYLKKENRNNSFECEIYLSLLIKNCKIMAVYRIFCLYSLFNQNLNYYIKRTLFNKWKKNIGNFTKKNENNNNNNNKININNSSDKK